MRLVLTLAALLACGAPASGQPREQPAQAAVMFAESEAYGTWLMRFNAIEAPLLAELGGLGAEWTAATAATGDWSEAKRAGLRAYVARIAGLVAQTNTALIALDRPVFPNLGISGELDTGALIETMVRNNREMQAVVEGMIPLHVAGERNDMQAAIGASNQLLSGLRGVMRSQILLARASQAATSPEHPYWHSVAFQLIFLRAGDRVLSTVPNLFSGARDRTLSADLSAMATELEANARAGNEKADRMGALLTEQLSNADGVEARALRQQISLIDATRANFPLALEFAALLRRSAASLRDGVIGHHNAGSVMREFPAFRQRMDAITNAETATVAGVD